MKIAFLAITLAVGLTLAACHRKDSTASKFTGTSSSGSSEPTGAASWDFVAFVNQQSGSEPPLSSAPAPTMSPPRNLGLGNAALFKATSFGTGDSLPPGTYHAATACAQAVTTTCNPAASTNLSSTQK